MNPPVSPPITKKIARKRTTTEPQAGAELSVQDWETIFREISTAPSVASYTASVNAIADHLPGAEPFRVLIATIISLRTRDEVTLPAAERLLARAETPAAVAGMPLEEIERLIYPAGFYRTKAHTISRVSRIIEEKHGGVVPSTLEELKDLPGVGLKTANLVLAIGFGIPAICVDTHVHRIANRMGWIAAATPDATGEALEKILPQEYWIPINQWLVAFGRTICTPGRPWCSRCPVYSWCDRVNVSRSR